MKALKLPLWREPLTTVLVYGEGQDRVMVLSVPDYGDVALAEQIADDVAGACNSYPVLVQALRIATDALGEIAESRRTQDTQPLCGIADRTLAEIDDFGTILKLLVPIATEDNQKGSDQHG